MSTADAGAVRAARPGDSRAFSWSVITPEGTIDSGQCDFLVVPAAGGELGILAGHAALVACVLSGDVRVSSSGSVRTVRVDAGLVDVRDNEVRILVAGAGSAPPAAPPHERRRPPAGTV